MSQGDNPESNLTFRAFKYDPNYVAFVGKDLTPGNPIELNFQANVPCNVLNIEEYSLEDVHIYPNPSHYTIYVKTSFSVDKVEFYNNLGIRIDQIKNSKSLDISNYTSGIYFLKVYSNNMSITKKIVKL